MSDDAPKVPRGQPDNTAGQLSGALKLQVFDAKTGKWAGAPLDHDAQALRVMLANPPARKKLASLRAADSATVIFAATTKYRDVCIVLANVAGTDQTVSVYHVEAGGTPSDDNALAKGMQLTAGFGPVQLDGLGLRNGESIQAIGGVANGVAVSVYGEEE